MQNSFNIWFLDKGIWLILIGIAGIVSVWLISYLIFKGLKLLGVDPERISDPNSQKLVNNIKNITVDNQFIFLR